MGMRLGKIGKNLNVDRLKDDSISRFCTLSRIISECEGLKFYLDQPSFVVNEALSKYHKLFI